MKILTKPMPKKILNQAFKKSESITFVYPISLDDLIDTGMEALNDRVEEACVGNNRFSLTDIGYEPVGVQDGAILIEVTAYPEKM